MFNRKTKSILFYFFFFALFIFINACSNKLDLPAGGGGDNNLGGAGDTTYIQLTGWNREVNPDWYDFDHPQDVIYGWDESIYVADTGNNRILQFSKTGFFYEDNIIDIPENIDFANPIAITQDVMQFIYAVNGTNEIFAYLPLSRYLPTLSDVFLVFQGPDSAQYVGIAADRTTANNVYITDKYHNQMLMAHFFYNRNDTLFAYEFQEESTIIAEAGSGVTTLDDPRQVAVDADLDIYFTQTCATNGVFFVQSMYWDGQLLQRALFNQFGDIHDRDLFRNPNDIAVRGQGSIKYVYVADTGHNLIRTYKFNNYVKEFEKQLLGDNGQTLFDNPMGVAVAPFDDEKEFVIYIADTNNNRIERYWLSIPKN